MPPEASAPSRPGARTHPAMRPQRTLMTFRVNGAHVSGEPIATRIGHVLVTYWSRLPDRDTACPRLRFPRPSSGLRACPRLSATLPARGSPLQGDPLVRLLHPWGVQMASVPLGGRPFKLPCCPGLGPRPKSALRPGLRGLNPAPLRCGVGKWGAPNSAVKVPARALNIWG